MARSSSRRYGSRGPKRRLIWARVANIANTSEDNRAGVSNMLEGFENQYGAEMLGYTVTRIIGSATTWATGSSAVDTAHNFGLGVRVADDRVVDQLNEDTEDRGVSPLNDPHADWMFHTVHPWVESQGPTQFEQANWNRLHFDIKSSRRIDELGQGLYFFWAIGANAYNGGVNWNASVLLRRP